MGLLWSFVVGAISFGYIYAFFPWMVYLDCPLQFVFDYVLLYSNRVKQLDLQDEKYIKRQGSFWALPFVKVDGLKNEGCKSVSISARVLACDGLHGV